MPLALMTGAGTLVLLIRMGRGDESLWGLAAVILCAVGGLITHDMAWRRLRQAERDLAAAADQTRLAEAETEEVRMALSSFTEAIDLMVLVVSPDGEVMVANDQAQRRFGGSLVGAPLLSVTFSQELNRMVAGAAQEGRKLGAELQLSHPQAWHASVAVWPEPPGNERILVALQDVSSERRLERVRRDFVANVSHEFRTPMTSIRTSAEALLDGGMDRPTEEKFLGGIIREIDRLSQISGDLLTLSSVEGAVVQREPINLAAQVQEAVRGLTPSAEAKGLELAASIPESLEVWGRPNLLSQVAVNLIQNAIAYTQEGSVRVGLEEQDGWAVLTVSDTGIGISAENATRIFERFYRVDRGRSRATGGTGLGLSIVKHVVEAHGGRIELKSRLQQGSTFTVHLPTAEPEA
ncbi:MAG: ATP-binding protein [Fimbriimonadaceae bacterium]|nr:ATP-binding protein [Fimbriimonadaceae bacterium]